MIGYFLPNERSHFSGFLTSSLSPLSFVFVGAIESFTAYFDVLAASEAVFCCFLGLFLRLR